ncbi:MAG: Gfo/Idh/MocA family oxidoreductase [Bacteroidales bacterium]|nr:Gfo/Idh/MocA family oxidoreductase [Bacteroidales bacterium]
MNPINTALCSYGMSGVVFHGPLLEAHPGYKIGKILERNRNDSKGKHPGAQLVRNFDALINDPSIELVVVNTPDHLHMDMATRAMKAGKHVVVEKPFTLKASDADQLIDLAEKQGVILSVFQNRRWDGVYLTVQEVIRSGKLGRLVDFEVHFDRFRNYVKESWKDQANGTGTLYNLGSHLVDQTLNLFGMPDRLFCDTRMLRDGAKTDDSYDLFLHYPGFKCMLRSSYLVREPGPSFMLHGTEGSFLAWGSDPQERDLKAGIVPGSKGWGVDPGFSHAKIHTDIDGEHLEGEYPLLPGNYLAYYDNVYDAIRNNTPLAVTAQQARDVIRIIEAAYESSRKGQVVGLD